MGKSIVFVNQKGGVGKTTSAINIGAYIALAGKKVLLVDFDSQGNMSSGVGITKEKPTIYELLAGMVSAEKAVKHTPVENLDAISASIDLSGAAIELVDQENREYYLKEALAPFLNLTIDPQKASTPSSFFSATALAYSISESTKERIIVVQ